MRAVGYIRVSTEEQVKNYSLGNQQRAIEDYCKRNHIELVKIYREEGVSATTTAKRIEFNSMIDYCTSKASDVQMLIVNDFNRFARNHFDHLSTKLLLKKFGIRLFSINQPLDDDPDGVMLEGIHSLVAERESTIKIIRVTDGMKSALEMGRWTFGDCYGYERGEAKTSPSMFVVQAEADLVRYAFEQVSQGKPKAQVILEMNRKGYTSRRGKALTKQSLDYMLKNRIYTGYVSSMGVFEQGDFEPIISVELYERVNKLKSSQLGKPHPRMNPDFPLRRFVKCVSCGKSLTGSWSTGRGGKKYGHYRCENKECRAVKLNREKLTALFTEELNTLSIRPKTLELVEAVAQDVWKERTTEEVKARKILHRRIDKLTERIDSLADAIIDGKINQETHDRKRAKLEAEIEEARSLIPQESITQDQLTNAITKTKAMLTDLPQTWNRLEIQQKVAFQQLIHPEGMTCDGEKLGTAKKSWLFIDFMDENSDGSKVVRPTISDWNRFEEWVNGLNSLALFLDNAEEESYKPLNAQKLAMSITTATDWNQK